MGRRARGQSAPTEPLDGPEPEPRGPLSPAELLETSPFEGDLDEELKKVPPSTLKPGLTLYLGAAVLVVAGFVGGIQADKQWGGSKSSNSALPGGFNRTGAGAGRYLGGGQNPFSGGGGFRNPGTGGTAPGAQGAGANATTGTVKMVDGSTVYVTTAGGGIVAIKTNGTTKIRIMKNGKVQDLAPGSTVVVQGTPGSDGSVTASTITQGGARTGGG